MDLPYDMLEEIFFMLKQIDWTGADFAICNKALLKLLLDNQGTVGGYVLERPWFIDDEDTMRTCAGSLLIEDRTALHSGIKHLRTGKVKRLELICVTGGHYHYPGEKDSPYAQTTDEEVECLLRDWPANKVILPFF